MGTGPLASLRQRAAGVAGKLPQVLQTALAAAVAWLLATEALGHDNAFFAPVAAVISLGITYGQRTRRAIEMTLGVALGILVADALVLWIGTGTAQIALVVGLAMAAAVALGGSQLLVTQAAISAVLVATIQSPADELSLARFVDGLVGGGVALVVNLLLFPANPVALVQRAAGPVLAELAAVLDDVAAALQARDVLAASAALSRARRLDPAVQRFGDAAAVGAEMARFAPPRRVHRPRLARYEAAAEHVDLAVRNVRVLARGAIRALELAENVPPDAPRSLRALSEAVRALGAALDEPGGPAAERMREAALEAAARATMVLEQTGNMSVNVIVGQVRSTAVDVLRSAGLARAEALEAVRAAAARRAGTA